VSGDVAIPVWLRVGPAPERMIGTVTIDVTKDIAEEQRIALAALLREAADEVENGERQ
jgi:hypothetical protein